ncbi:MAG: KEOPS complex subunit Pcc1 [Candidatus Aenigmatarchaeota archaeon]
MKARLNIPTNDSEIVKQAIEVDIQNRGRLNSKIRAEDELEIVIESEKLSGLRAGLNTYLRLVQTSQTAIHI